MSQIKAQRCTVNLTDATGLVTLAKVEISSTEVAEDIEVLSPYGFESNFGKGASAIVISVNGTRFVLAPQQIESRPKLKDLETQQYSSHGQQVYMKEDGTTHYKATKHTFEGDVEVNGNIKCEDAEINGKKFGNHITAHGVA